MSSSRTKIRLKLFLCRLSFFLFLFSFLLGGWGGVGGDCFVVVGFLVVAFYTKVTA